MEQNKKERFIFLDGIRGIMSINVVICHFIVVYYPAMYFEEFASTYPLQSIVATTPLSVFVNGNIAVQYFFVLAGFLTAYTLFHSAPYDLKGIIRRIIKRYFRFLPIVACAIIFTFLLMKNNLLFHLDIAEITKNPSFIQNYCYFTPTINGMLTDIFINTFIKGSNYVGPFWTIHYEFWGQAICLVICTLLRKNKTRRIFYPLLAVVVTVFIDYNFLPFFIGVFVADLICFPEKDATVLSKHYFCILGHKSFISIISVIGVYFACVPMYFVGIYSFWGKIPLLFPTLLRSIGTGILLFVLFKTPNLQKFFEHKAFQFLGKLSFPIYAFHWTLMLSLQSWLFKILSSNQAYDVSALFSFGITCIVTLILAYLIWFSLERKK